MDEKPAVPNEQSSQPVQPSAEVPKQAVEEVKQIAQPTQNYVPRTSSSAEARPSRMQKLKEFVVECQRVLRVTKKPDGMEFKTIVKISGIGMIVVGFLGFLVHFIKELMF